MRHRVLLTVAVAVLLSGCAGEADLTRTELERQVSSRISSDDPDQQKVRLHCEGGLSREVDAHRDCRVHLGEERVGVRVRTTSSDPLELTMVPFLSRDALAEEIVGLLRAEGHAAQECHCAEALMGRAGAEAACQVRMDGREQPLEVRVVEVDGLLIDFAFEGV